MNDLEPWKIWAVTGALVFFIIGSTAARVRPLPIASDVAQASILSAPQPAAIGAVDPFQTSDPFDAYSFGGTHRFFTAAPYSGAQAYTVVPINAEGTNSTETRGPDDDDDQSPVLDVTQELFSGEAPRGDQFATNEVQLVPVSSEPIFLDMDDQSGVSQNLIENWSNSNVIATPMEVTYEIPSEEGLRFPVQNEPVDVIITDLTIPNAVVHMTLNGVAFNGTVVPVELSGPATNPVVESYLSLRSDLATYSNAGGSPEYEDEVRAQVVNAVQEEALAQLAEAQEEQQVVDLYKVRTGVSDSELGDLSLW